MSTEPLGKKRKTEVDIKTLVSRLSEIGALVQEIDLRPAQPYKLFLFGSKLPAFPFGDREWVWYSLLLSSEQTVVDRDEVDAVLRHCWHSVVPFFPEELEQEMEPENERERAIADKVDVKARAVRDGKETWDGSTLETLKASIGFDLSVEECGYLEALVEWHKGTPISN